MRSLMVRYENLSTVACPKTNPRPPTWSFKMSINVIFCALLDPASGLFSLDFRGEKIYVYFSQHHIFISFSVLFPSVSLYFFACYSCFFPLLSSLFSPLVCRSFSSFVLWFLFVNFLIFNPLLAFVLLYMSFSLLSFSFCFSFCNLM
jgi:hypothetical protein